MAKCVQNIINTNVAASGTKNASEVTSGKPYASGHGTYIDSPISGNGDIKFADNFVEAVDRATLKLRNTDCTQTVLDFFSSKFPMVSSKVKKSYNWATQNSPLESGMSKLGNALKGGNLESLTDQFCDTVTNAFRTIIFYADAATKYAFVLFKKIDALKRKIEKALLEFTDAVRNCLVSVIVDAKNAINRVVRNVLDFGVVLDLMNNCPCIANMVAAIFNCKRDKDGNKLTTPEQILKCVTEKFSIDPSGIINAINKFIDKTILDTINKGFNMLDEFIKTTMELLMAPFRALIRLYASILNEKINVTSIIRFLGPAECLLLYTVEHDNSGKEYLGMSVIDIINTLKFWANCFEFVCKSFVDDVSNKIKELNENLRLDDKYWRDVMSIDLYQSAVGAKVQARQPRAAMIREIFVKNQNKGKGVFIGIIDAFKQVGTITIDAGISGNDIGTTAEAVKFRDGPDREDVKTNNGNTQLNSDVEDNLMSIEMNLFADSDSFFVEKFLQLVDWEAGYIKTQSHISQIEKIASSHQTNNNDYSSMPVSAINDKGNSVRVSYKGNVQASQPIVTPTYQLVNDYNQDTINKIDLYKQPIRLPNESLQNYYARWYSEAMV